MPSEPDPLAESVARLRVALAVQQPDATPPITTVYADATDMRRVLDALALAQAEASIARVALRQVEASAAEWKAKADAALAAEKETP